MVGAILSGAGLVSTGAQAQTPPAVDPVPYWWFHGTVEAGGRDFLNNPPRNGSAYLGQPSLAKFYEYRDLRPGPFGNIWLAAGTKDGLYQVDVGGKNIGYDDQRYYLDASKAGQHYFNFTWDQSPHLYSTSAQTPYLGVGTTALTLPAGYPNKLNTTSAGIVPFLHQTDIGIKRDTASASYRWTPTDDWDIKADYSHLHRTGTQVDGVTGLSGTSAFSGSDQVPRPVDDTTQNYGLNGEYAGMSPWGKKFTFKLAYNGSQYSDDLSSYTIQSISCTNATSASCAGTTATSLWSPFARVSLPPSNQMNAVSGTLGADLPWMSRYVGTVSYNMMRQNDAFMPMTINPSASAAALVLPASSLNGAINTLLSNNVVTTKITPDLTNKVSYRYYNFDNQTPELLFPSWVSYDHLNAAGNGTELAIRSLSISYIKQNFGEDLVWHPTRAWTLGAAYGFERYTWSRESVDATNEHSGKVFADWKPASWFTLRSSGYYADRRYNNYDYNAYVSAIQFPGRGPVDSWFINPAYRVLMTDNRQRWKANFAIDTLVLPGITVTPNFKYQDDYYGLNAANNLGLADSRSWSGGVDVTFIVDPRTSFMLGYTREFYTQLVNNINATTNNSVPGVLNEATNDRTVVDTFIAVGKYAAIPEKLDLTLRYTASHAVDTQNLLIAAGTAPTGGQFPDVTTWFQRVDAEAVYTFDKTQIASMGWNGVVKAKLHYAWERNAVANWQNDPILPYSPFINTTAIWLAGDNPNYNVHMLMGSLAYTW